MLALAGVPLAARAQDLRASVSRASGIQLGAAGLWVYREGRIADPLALRFELGLDGFVASNVQGRLTFLMTPVLSVEPRWYYNLDKRLNTLKDVQDNSGNFLALRLHYRPNWSAVSSDTEYVVYNTIGLAALWGIRRNIGPYFNYEAGLGVGVQFFFPPTSSRDARIGLYPVPQLRIGYRFNARKQDTRELPTGR